MTTTTTPLEVRPVQHHFVGRYSPLNNMRMAEAIKRYLGREVMPGHFTHAVLCNDLRRAIANSQFREWMYLDLLVEWLEEFAPESCWGSEEKVAAWMKKEPGDG